MARKVGVLVLMLALSAAAVQAGEKSQATDGVKIRFVSLAECRAIALQHGVGQPALLLAPGIGLESLVSPPTKTPPVQYQLWAYSAGCDPEKLVLVCPEVGTSRLEFERDVHQRLLDVETAYWNLYGSYGNLYSRVRVQAFSREAYRTVKAQLDAGNKNVGELGQARGQYELFRAQRLAAIDTTLDNERQLRALMGMPAEDGSRLVPCDAPKQKRVEPDWKSALHEALTTRPELLLTHRDLERAQLKMRLVNVFCRLACTFCPCKRIEIPVASRFCCAPLYKVLPDCPDVEALHRHTRLQLVRTFEVLQDQELKAERFLGLQYRRIFSYYAQIQAQRAQREAYGEQLKARFQEFLAERKTLDILLESQRFWADALANEYAAITSYNNALCGFQYAKGAILAHAHVVLADAAPEGATTEAVDRERQRTRQRMKSRSGNKGLSFLGDTSSPEQAVRNLLGDQPQLDAPSMFGFGAIR